MWYTFLPKVLNMSLTASIVILFVLLARLVLKRAPKLYSYLLWIVVLFRLLSPVALTSGFSFLGIMDVPVTQTSTIEYIPTDIVYTEYPAVDIPVPGVSEAIHETLPQGEEQLAADPLEAPTSIATCIWFLGLASLLSYSAVSLLRLRRMLISAIPLRDNIYLADYIVSPFVIGLVRPKIYLPSTLSGDEQEYLLLHEQYHIRRFDHVVKLLFFAALCIHWFNPLVWLAFVLSVKDMEMSCDEAVLAKFGKDIRRDYSASLLRLTTGGRVIAGAPLAFGEGDTKSRIRNVLNWKKPSVWITTLAAVVSVIMIAVLAFNPKENDLYASDPFGHNYRVASVAFEAPQYSFTYTPDTAPRYSLTSDYQFLVMGDILQEGNADEWKALGGLSEISLTEDNFDRYFIIVDGISGLRGEKSIEQLRRDNHKAWQLILENDLNRVFYYILQQSNGDIYLAYGYHSAESEGASSTSLIRWLFQLEQLDSVSCLVQTSGHETYCEANWYPDGQFDFDYDELPSAVVYDTGTLTFTVDGEYDTLTVGEDYYTYPSESSGICEKETYTLSRNSEGNFVLKVSRRHDVRDEYAVYYVPYDTGKYVFQVLFPVNSDSASGADHAAIPTATPTEDIAEADPLETAINAAILEYNKNRTPAYDFACESHIILDTVNSSPAGGEAAASVTVYAMVLYATYNYSGSAFQEVGGSHIPTALTFEVQTDGEYTLTEYWEPRDGSYYAQDIKNKFPKAIQEDALDTQKFIVSQIQVCYAKAIKFGNTNTDEIIDNLFESIQSSPTTSSNPGDYIDAHPLEYRELTYYGDYALRYIFSTFLEGGQTGLKGHLMRIVMDSLIGEEAIAQEVANGQEYFDAWLRSAERMEKEHGLDYMKTYTPKAYLLLQLLRE